MNNLIINFVMDDGQFVNPEKLVAVELYGLEKAIEMWKNGEPDFTTRMKLSTIACNNFLLGIKIGEKK